MEKEYRNSVRSRKLIKEAVVSLIEKSIPAEKITITQVVEEADINRGTFYSHYQSIYDVFREIKNDVYDGLKDSFKDFAKAAFFLRPEVTLKGITDFLKENEHSYKIFVKTHMLWAFFVELRSSVIEEFNKNTAVSMVLRDEKERHFYIDVLVSSSICLYFDYFNETSIFTLDEIEAEIVDLIRRFVSSIKKHPSRK